METVDNGISSIIDRLKQSPFLMFVDYQTFLDNTKDSEVGAVAYIRNGRTVPEVQKILKKRDEKYGCNSLEGADITVVLLKCSDGWEMISASIDGTLEEDGSITPRLSSDSME